MSVPSTTMLLAQADLLLLMVDLLRDPRELQLPDPGQAREVARAACPDDVAMVEAVEALVAGAQQAATVTSGRESWSAEYNRLFEGSIACPINEAAYIRRDKGALLADVNGFYLAFGLTLAMGKGERPDHLRCELEFTAMLLFMLAQARERGSDENQDVTLAALRSFAGDHIGEWLESFCARLIAETSLDLYARLAAACTLALRGIAASLDLPAPQPPQECRPGPDHVLDVEEEVMECGMAGGAVPVACTVSVEGR